MNESNKILQAFLVSKTFAQQRLDQTLVKLMPEFSRTQIQDWINSGSVLVNGKPVKVKTKVKGGEMVTVNVTLKPPPQWEAQAIPLDIVYEDEALLVINKPIGLVVHPGAGNADQTLLNAILHHSPQSRSLPRAGILHRLDKNTSGLLVIAKTSIALKKLGQQLKKRTLLREYQAIVQGTLISGGTVSAPIGRHPIKRNRMAVLENGRQAVTHFRVAEKYRVHTRLKISLETGRTHQIRVHLAHLRHPIVGDPTYGGRLMLTKGMLPELIEALRKFKRQALHAFALGLTHPITNEFIRWEIGLPDDMKQLIHLLKEDELRNRNNK